jgi:protein-S-isoprenylcysteine O-methyltransferase Ste14
MFGISLFLWHLTFTVLPPLRSNICLNPDLVNPGLTSWSWYTGTFVCIIFIAAPIRLQAYSRLGKNFTFMLAKPDKLVTTGIYSYVQHPSYTSLLVLTSAWFWTFLRLNGISACFLPAWLVHMEALTLAPPILATLTTFFGITLRVKDEEEMLRKTFGKEYEEYHAKTKRFIPGLF